MTQISIEFWLQFRRENVFSVNKLENNDTSGKKESVVYCEHIF